MGVEDGPVQVRTDEEFTYTVLRADPVRAPPIRCWFPDGPRSSTPVTYLPVRGKDGRKRWKGPVVRGRKFKRSIRERLGFLNDKF